VKCEWQYVVNANSGIQLMEKKILETVLVTEYLVTPQLKIVRQTVFNLETKDNWIEWIMEITLKKLLIPIILGIVIWIIAFFVIGWTQISEDPTTQALYIPMVILFGIGTVLLMILFLWWYLLHLNIDLKQEWLQESLFFGFIIMMVQYLLDISIFTFIQVD
jgi:hypothetical protein